LYKILGVRGYADILIHWQPADYLNLECYRRTAGKTGHEDDAALSGRQAERIREARRVIQGIRVPVPRLRIVRVHGAKSRGVGGEPAAEGSGVGAHGKVVEAVRIAHLPGPKVLRGHRVLLFA